MVFINAFYIVTCLFDWLWCVFYGFWRNSSVVCESFKIFLWLTDCLTIGVVITSMKPWSYKWLEFVLSQQLYIYIYIHIYAADAKERHWGRVTYICVSDLTSIGSDNGLSPGRRQAIIRTNAGILLIGPLGTNFSETFIEIKMFSLTNLHLKVSFAKVTAILSRPQCVKLLTRWAYWGIKLFILTYWLHMATSFITFSKDLCIWYIHLPPWTAKSLTQLAYWRHRILTNFDLMAPYGDIYVLSTLAQDKI